MSDQWSFSDGELEEYFDDPEARKPQQDTNEGSAASASPSDLPSESIPEASDEEASFNTPDEAPSDRDAAAGSSVMWTGWAGQWIDHPQVAQAASVLGVVAGLGGLGLLVLIGLFAALGSDIPSTQRLENPTVELATIAYTADGEELARYARQNRSWVPYDSIGTNVVNALIATEDHRFRRHWGVDIQGIAAAAFSTLTGDLRGASTISQQLARNLYDEEVGREVTIMRKIREMITAVELERRYTKTEIVEMYLNTVAFGSNAFGIEAASRTYYGKAPQELAVPEAATLIGLLKATTYYNPVRNPENAKMRRNVVMGQMARYGMIEDEELAVYREEEVAASYHSAELYTSLAPYFAEHVRTELQRMTRDPEHPLNEYDMYGDGLRVYTTVDSRMQQHAKAAVDSQMTRLQAVVDYEWSSERTRLLSREFEPYMELVRGEDYEPFSHFWSSNTGIVNEYIRDTPHYQRLVDEAGQTDEEALQSLRTNETFVDSLRTLRTRLEAGLVSMDPRTGQVKAWVGGRDFRDDKYDKVSIAQRQPGSTFKPFTYTAAIDNGYSPYDTFLDSTFVYEDVNADTTWSPNNFSGYSGQELTMTQALARSINTITARVALEIGPSTIAQYARRMGIQSELQAVPSISLGTSNVTLLEMVTAYSTLANGGLRNEPQVITRIEDRFGNLLWAPRSAPQEVLSERTAYTVADMMRGVIDFGTGQRIRTQFGLGDYDLAAKTGTTQDGADGWFIMMHPDLVTGSWVGFNDQRITFRTNAWGQGGRNALFLVGDYTQRIANMGTNAEESPLRREAEFPLEEFMIEAPEDDRDGGGVGW
ncbi:penicillin-binding protein [Longimonas halophila]|uniref:Penicillin-binding protein n=1 Tax=Longimonas halophila TaxID=1469170 RepID=A0A2H3NV20_9BACT|nr:PBP1A family penicillin-binding protein [Longimonas halophila]PEN08427.1 penicillin-binding protein [Longimonas halophila]